MTLSAFSPNWFCQKHFYGTAMTVEQHWIRRKRKITEQWHISLYFCSKFPPRVLTKYKLKYLVCFNNFAQDYSLLYFKRCGAIEVFHRLKAQARNPCLGTNLHKWKLLMKWICCRAVNKFGANLFPGMWSNGNVFTCLIGHLFFQK